MVAGQSVGVRLLPHDRAVRLLAPAGIEFAPPRVERSTGPGRHDFEIVADASIPLEQDMERRDFTINAIAQRLETGELLDPARRPGRPGARRAPDDVSPTSFRDDPLRIVRGLRFVSELGLDPDEETLAQMREWAPQVRLVSAERIGGGLAADGQGELSKLLLGPRPAKALRLARDTGVLTDDLAGVRAGDRVTTRAPSGRACRSTSTCSRPCSAGPTSGCRSRSGSRSCSTTWRSRFADRELPHAEAAAELARPALNRLRYPARLIFEVVRVIAGHAFPVEREFDGEAARRFLARHGERIARFLFQHKRADLLAKNVEPWELPALEAMEQAVMRERAHPYRVSDLAIDGNDLLALGIPQGPEIGRMLDALLDEVLADPSRNDPDWLRERARALA